MSAAHSPYGGAGLVYLQTANFGIDKIPEGPVMCNSIKGFSVVLFYSPSRCQYSPAALQELKRIVGTVNGVIFAAVNIDKYMDIVRMSRNTLTSVEGVPYIMLYHNGVPKQIYPDNYPFTAEAIRSFATTVSLGIAKAANNVAEQQPRGGAATSRPPRNTTIYFISNPSVKRKNCTYISVDDQNVAVSKKQPAGQQRESRARPGNYAPVGNAHYR